jgi:hypothetical protein
MILRHPSDPHHPDWMIRGGWTRVDMTAEEFRELFGAVSNWGR